MNDVDKQYKDFLRYILKKGVEKKDRTGTGTISVFDYTMRFNMKEGFPLITSKKMFMKGVIHELIWFLRGDTNIKYLLDNGVHIWDGDAYKNYMNNWDKYVPRIGPCTKEEFIEKLKTYDDFCRIWGDLGPIYGKQWRKWNQYTEVCVDNDWGNGNQGGAWVFKQIDQIQNLIDDLKNNPDSRRLMVSAWNVGEIEDMKLPPCHYGFQCYTRELTRDERIDLYCKEYTNGVRGNYEPPFDDFIDAKLSARNIPKRAISLKWTQRSCDVPLGIPFNIASYGLLLHLLGREVNMMPEDLIFSGGDCHIYTNQMDGVRLQLRQKTFSLPSIELANITLDDLKYEDVKVVGYESSPTVNFPLSN